MKNLQKYFTLATVLVFIGGILSIANGVNWITYVIGAIAGLCILGLVVLQILSARK